MVKIIEEFLKGGLYIKIDNNNITIRDKVFEILYNNIIKWKENKTTHDKIIYKNYYLRYSSSLKHLVYTTHPNYNYIQITAEEFLRLYNLEDKTETIIESIKPEDLINGEIYHTSYLNSNKDRILEFIFKKNKNKFLSMRLDICEYSSTCNFNQLEPGEIIRLATPEEKQWLELCIQEGYYINRPINEIKTIELW